MSKRDGILQAATELFAKDGFRGTPLAAIADRSGVTAPAITHHFGTKRSLLLEVVEALDRLDEERMAAAPDATGLEQLGANRNWAGLLLENSATATLARLRIVMVAEALDPEFPVHGHFVARNRRLVRMLVEILHRGQRDGSIRADIDPAIVAAEVVAFMQGATMQWFLDPAGTPLQAMVDRYFDRLVAEVGLTG